MVPRSRESLSMVLFLTCLLTEPTEGTRQWLKATADPSASLRSAQDDSAFL